MLHELEVTVEDEEREGKEEGFLTEARERMLGQDFMEAWGERLEEGLSLEWVADCEVDAVLGSGKQAE